MHCIFIYCFQGRRVLTEGLNLYCRYYCCCCFCCLFGFSYGVSFEISEYGRGHTVVGAAKDTNYGGVKVAWQIC
ncbi:hypothetical protein I7I48_06997 [Histoplasma ohiense]|nr:hypothetical protein I7I48_06997 [Histoplasma ohiense (nom. inval.)]